MRHTFFLAMMVIVAACSEQPRPEGVQLDGQLANAEGVVAELTYFNEYLNNDRVVLDLNSDPSGVFSLSLDFQEPLTAGLRLGRTEIPLFLAPGDALTIEGDASRPLESIVYSGTGSANNAFLLSYQREVESKIGDRFVAQQAGQRDAEAFKQLLDSIYQEKMSFLNNGINNGGLSPEFVAYIETRLTYERYGKLLDYPVMHQRANQLPEAPFMEEAYSAFLQDKNIFDDSKLENLAYTNFLLSYLTYYGQNNPEAADAGLPANQQTYVLAGKALSGLSRDFVQALMLGRELSYGEMDDAVALYSEYVGGNASVSYKNRIMAIYNNMQRLAPGNPAPDFTMTDINGNEVSLSDFRGKVVYLDFWASWCGPCMREMPYFKELKARMADQKDLVFVYVSIDTDTEAWRNTIDRHEITGVHFNTPGRERGVPALYNVKWIPSFFIIGKDGNMFDNRPPKPSDPEIDEVLLKAVNS